MSKSIGGTISPDAVPLTISAPKLWLDLINSHFGLALALGSMTLCERVPFALHDRVHRLFCDWQNLVRQYLPCSTDNF
jgi:hypothetical protein